MRNCDMFGHMIKLNFNRNGDTHKTFIGGFVSILLKILMLVYVVMRSHKLFTFHDPTIGTTNTLLKLEDEGDVLYKDTSLVIF